MWLQVCGGDAALSSDHIYIFSLVSNPDSGNTGMISILLVLCHLKWRKLSLIEPKNNSQQSLQPSLPERYIK